MEKERETEEEVLTEKKAIELIHEAANTYGMDPSNWTITFDLEGTAEVYYSDPVKAHIKVHPLTEEGRAQHPLIRNAKLFRFVAYHEVGHIHGQHDAQHEQLKSRLSSYLVPSLVGVSATLYGLLKVLEFNQIGLGGLTSKILQFIEYHWVIPPLLMVGGLAPCLGLCYFLIRRQSMALEQEANLFALEKMFESKHFDGIAATVGLLLALKKSGVYQAATSHPPLKEEVGGMIRFLKEEKKMDITINETEKDLEVIIDGKRVVSIHLD